MDQNGDVLRQLSRTTSRRHESVTDDPDVSAELAELHHTFVDVSADIASNNIVFVCKTCFINCLMEELGMSTAAGNQTPKFIMLSREETSQKHAYIILTPLNPTFI